MKSRFILFNRAGVYYREDTVTRKQHSLRTKELKVQAKSPFRLRVESWSLLVIYKHLKCGDAFWADSKVNPRRRSVSRRFGRVCGRLERKMFSKHLPRRRV
jgi:hypothetical protein